MLLYWILLPIVWVLAHILFRFEVIGRENLKAVRDGRAYVIAPNHIANLDPVLIAITIFDWKRLRILAKEELFKNPLAGWFLRCMGAVRGFFRGCRHCRARLGGRCERGLWSGNRRVHARIVGQPQAAVCRWPPALMPRCESSWQRLTNVEENHNRCAL